MTSEQIKAAMHRNDISSIAELREALNVNGFYYSSLLLDVVHMVSAMPEYVLISLEILFEKLDKEKADWSREKLDELQSEIDYI